MELITFLLGVSLVTIYTLYRDKQLYLRAWKDAEQRVQFLERALWDDCMGEEATAEDLGFDEE